MNPGPQTEQPNPGWVAQVAEHHPVHQKVVGLIQGQDIYLSYGFDPCLVRSHTGGYQLMILSLSPLSSLSKINNTYPQVRIKKIRITMLQ